MSNTTKSIKTRKYVAPDHEMVGEILGRSEKRGGRNEIASLQEIKDFDDLPHMDNSIELDKGGNNSKIIRLTSKIVSLLCV